MNGQPPHGPINDIRPKLTSPEKGIESLRLGSRMCTLAPGVRGAGDPADDLNGQRTACSPDSISRTHLLGRQLGAVRLMRAQRAVPPDGHDLVTVARARQLVYVDRGQRR